MRDDTETRVNAGGGRRDVEITLPAEETAMTTSATKHPANIPPGHSSIGQAAKLLGIYVAMYLAVGGIVHALTSPNAVAAMVPGSEMVLSTGGVETPTRSIKEPTLPTMAPNEGSERIESPRECNLRAGIDTECIF